MENKQQNNFFNSKTNGILLLVLIVLMVIALVWMKKDGGKYFGFLEKGDEQKVEQQIIKPKVKDT